MSSGKPDAVQTACGAKDVVFSICELQQMIIISWLTFTPQMN